MGVWEEITEKFEKDFDLIRKCFRESLSGLRTRESHLNGVQESASERCRELSALLEALQVRAKEVEDKERESHLFLEQVWKELVVKKNELSSIRDDIRVREEKLTEQENLIGGLFERFELEGKSIGDIRSSIDEALREICVKERLVADNRRELDLVRKQIESREHEVQKKEEKLKTVEKEIEVREKIVCSKQGMLEARESELKAGEKVLELQKELDLKHRELDSAQKSKESCSKEPDSVNPVGFSKEPDSVNPIICSKQPESANRVPSGGMTKRRRISEENGGYENDLVQKASDSVDSGHPGSGCDLNESQPKPNQAAKQAGGVPQGDSVKVEVIDDNDDSCARAFDVPDPEFNDFDKGREAGCFASNQFWACYDDVDGMPRFYAKIKKVHTPGFKIRIEWLEPDPDDPDEIDWAEQFPVGCGKFRIGYPEVFSNRLVFSHQVLCNHMDKSHFLIYPRKGEIWALFKDWDTNWITDPGNHVKHRYEIVQIVSDFVKGAGITVAFLEKVRGFVSLFQQSGQNPAPSILIPSRELFRFSHQIPSFKMSGTENEGVPEACFELDPASLPTNPNDICYPLWVDAGNKKCKC